MGRTMSQQPAKCICCGKDFESSGKLRYQVLKTHLMEVHKLSGDQAKKINTINNYYSNCIINNITINVNIDGVISSVDDIAKLLTDKVRESLESLIAKDDSLVVKLFDTLHCDPKHPETHIGNIPNKKKDQMLVVKHDGEVDILPKTEGAMIILDKIQKESEAVDKVTENDNFIVQSVKGDCEYKKRETINGIITHLENLPRNERRVTENILRDRRRRAMRDT